MNVDGWNPSRTTSSAPARSAAADLLDRERPVDAVGGLHGEVPCRRIGQHQVGAALVQQVSRVDRPGALVDRDSCHARRHHTQPDDRERQCVGHHEADPGADPHAVGEQRADTGHAAGQRRVRHDRTVG
jgi:hypothetical protein